MGLRTTAIGAGQSTEIVTMDELTAPRSVVVSKIKRPTLRFPYAWVTLREPCRATFESRVDQSVASRLASQKNA
jgi:hypothetical protein